MITAMNSRILVIDDMPAIHENFRKILGPQVDAGAALSEFEHALFGDEAKAARAAFEVDSAYQGQEGLVKVHAALKAGRPYAMAFVDMRMPPGWDGVETIEHLWQVDAELQVVICTAYSDASWDDILARLDVRDRLLILKKPFDVVEAFQLASSLTAKWQLARDAALKLARLEDAVQHRTIELRAANETLQQEIVLRAHDEAELKIAASVFHNTLDGVMITDPARRIVSVNPAFIALTGYSAEQAVGQPVGLLRCDQQSPEFYLEMWATVEREGRWQGELWSRRSDGGLFLAELNTVMVPGSDGRSERYVSMLHDITGLRRHEERIRHLAFHDALTGLPNRMLLNDRLEVAIAAARRNAARLGLMFIDLDRFKAVNDSFGHEAGNDLLKEVAERLRRCVRESDTVARMGGDEFVVLLGGVDVPENYALVARKIIDSLSTPVVLEGRAMQVGASIGIACFPDDGLNSIELMKNADAAMYAAKTAGRGTCRFFQPTMTGKAEQALRFEMELRQAIPNGQLELYYQPKVMLQTGCARGVEALVRWRHPVLGMVQPGQFIPLAEATGIISDIGDWVLEEACRQSRAWQLEGLGRVKIAVNVSVRQLQRHDLVDRIESLARTYQIAHSDLEIELTESVFMGNPEEVVGMLTRLRTIGVMVAIDDFGTGYSSLGQLRRLPVDVLKIDRSFVMNADHDEGDAQVVKLILAFGQALSLSVVAEGVETESQAEFLRSCGCTTAQGYLYARPQPAAQTAVWLREHSDTLLQR